MFRTPAATRLSGPQAVWAPGALGDRGGGAGVRGAGGDSLRRPEGRVGAWPDCRPAWRRRLAGLGTRTLYRAEPREGDARCRGTDDATSTVVGFFDHSSLLRFR